jgi:hypothetical protein
MAWRRRPDSEQACRHPRYVVENRSRVDSTERLELRRCLRCWHRWLCVGAERPARTTIAICGAPWRAA